MKYRILVAIFFIAALGAIILFNVYSEKLEERSLTFSFGLIADCQYCADPGSGERKYAMSEEKLEQCVNHFNTMSLEYVVHLGDFIDRDYKSFEVVDPIYKQLNMPKYHVLGNHDFSVSDELKKDVPERMGLSSRYYDFEVMGWRFVVLDGNDVSFHAYPEGSEKYFQAAKYYQQHGNSSPKWNGALGAEQLSWLNRVLKEAAQVGEKVVLYCHFPVYPENVHNLWNAKEVVEVIENYNCVKAYINGHNHAGNYGIKNGIHYLTMKGMVDTEETSYAVIKVLEDRLEVKGEGREEDKNLEIRK